jgi:hypothetical protein
MKKPQKERVEDDGGASGGRVAEPLGFSITWLSKRVQKQNRTTLKVIWLLMSLLVAGEKPTRCGYKVVINVRTR